MFPRPMDPLLDPLNDAQRQAVLHGDGPLLVLAGAGSGKTRVIVHRIARLVRDERVLPWHVLAVTFTNKAAGEMRERLEQLLGDAARELWVSTFHAFGARFLRREAASAGLDASFPIYDTDDQLRLVKQAMAALRMGDGEPLTPREALSRIDRWKNHGVAPAAAEAAPYDVEGQAARAVYARYEEGLRRAGAVDFGDLLLRPQQVLDADARLRERWAGRFRYVLVDEFQDTNPAQYRLVKLLAGPRRNVCVVGDDDQAIYRWRGADVSNILGFDQDFPGTSVVKLEENYRSTSFILEAAHAVISQATRRREKKLFTRREGGQPLAMMVGADEHEEAERIASGIQACRRAGAPWEEIAVLYRTNAQSRPLEAALRGARVPYVVVRGTSFYDRAEVKDAAAYLRLALAPRSDLDLLRVVNRPARGIGEKSVERLQAFAAERGLALFDALAGVEEMGDLAPKARKALAAFRDLVQELHRRVASLDAGIAVQEVLEKSQMIERLRAEGTDEAVERAENLMELLAAAREFDEARAGTPPPGDADEPATPPLARFLEQIALLGEADADTPEGRVALMTLHAAKGLEFEAVFLAGMEDGVLPHDPPWARNESPGERAARFDEERRLCYVGMTRAKSLLTLTLARRRMRFGEMGPTWRDSEPSRFLRDVPPDAFGGEVARRVRERSAPPAPRPPVVRRLPGALEGEPHIVLDEGDGFSAAGAPRRPPSRPASFDDDLDQRPEAALGLQVGARVCHPSLGEGIVRACEGPGPDAKVTVAFFGAGEKRVIARFLRRS
jgi:DNA helicase-2/ATP-dependent DNA helicase PcrA